MNVNEIMNLNGSMFIQWTGERDLSMLYRFHSILIAFLLLNNPGPFYIQYFYKNRRAGYRVLPKIREFLDAANVVERVSEDNIVLKNGSRVSCLAYSDSRHLRGISGVDVTFVDDPTFQMYQEILYHFVDSPRRFIMNIIDEDPKVMNQIDPFGVIPVKQVSVEDAISSLKLEWVDPKVFYSKPDKENRV